MKQYIFVVLTLVFSFRGQSATAEELECLMGTLSWRGAMKVEFHVYGLVDQNQRLIRVKINRSNTGPFRYEVIRQSNIDPLSSQMLSFDLAHEDGAAYYQARVDVSNERYIWSTDGFTVQDPNENNFFNAKISWRDLFGRESSAAGACYIPL